MKNYPLNLRYTIGLMIVGSMIVVVAACTRKEHTSENKNSVIASDSITLFTKGDSVTDIDGNVYHTVKLGSQVWMVENLNVAHYRNGEPILNQVDDGQWSKLAALPAYCNYNNDTALSKTYGRLYNWYAVHDARNVAPEHWHIPTLTEWETLIHYLDGNAVSGGKLKESTTLHWDSPNTGATNSAGFTALPAGERNNDGTYTNLGFSGGWWTATGSDGDFASTISILSNSESVSADIDDMHYGYSIRCIHD